MEFVLLMAGSITHAQRMAAMLDREGVRASIARAPAGVDPRGCGYGVKVRRDRLDAALGLLRRRGIAVRGVYEKAGERWQEVVP